MTQHTKPPARANGRRARLAAAHQRRKQRRWLLGGAIGALVVGVLALSAIGGRSSGAVPVSVKGPAALRVGSVAPAFSAPTLEGARFVYQPQKPTLLYFMAGWCGTCVPESQALARIQPSVGDQAVLVAVDSDPSDPWSSLRSFYHSVGSPEYKFAKDDGQVDAAFGVNSLETNIVLDASGRIVYRHVGGIDDAAIRAALAKAGVTA